MKRLHSYNENEINFSKIDDHAKQASTEDTKSFEALVKYLNSILQNGSVKNAQLMLARGLMSWIGHAQTILDVNAPYNSPMNLVVNIVNRKVSHAQAFKMFCGYANIDCRVVVDRAKGNPYRAGDGDAYFIQNQMWNIFTADGHQHIVHPRWCAEVTVGASCAGETTIETDGVTRISPTRDERGHIHYGFDDFWFCTHPKIFVTRCLPNIQHDQLLPSRDMVKSVNDFLALPDLREAFFVEDLTLLTTKSCRLKSNKGRCQIIIRSNKSKSLKFSYEMSIIGQDLNGININDLPQLVLFSRNRDDYEFDIQFPVIGDYRFIVRLHVDDKIEQCCEFRIKCTEANNNCRRVPFENGLEGYGYGPSAELSGLRSPSESSGKVYIEPSTSANENGRKNKVLKFQVEEECVDNTEYTSELVSVGANGTAISHPDKSKVTVNPATCRMTVDLFVDQPGEYGLVINARQRGTENNAATPVVKYILTTQRDIHDQQLKIKQKKREVIKENRLALKKGEKRLEQGRLDAIQVEVKQLERQVNRHSRIIYRRVDSTNENNNEENRNENRTVPEELESLQTEDTDENLQVSGRRGI